VSLHIGEKIQERLKELGMTKTVFASRINCSPPNVYNIFERESIDSKLLMQISVVLRKNFFQYYYNEIPDCINHPEQDEAMKSLQSENAILQERVRSLQTEISHLKEINSLLKMLSGSSALTEKGGK